MELNWQAGLQLLALIGFGGLFGAIVAAVSAALRLKSDWETLRGALVPYLSSRKAAGDIEAEFLLEAVGPMDLSMKEAARAIREVQERLRKR
jgi:hypothetical protein